MKALVWKDTCTPIFITLFTIPETQKQSKVPSTEERLKKMLYINTMEYYSAITKKWNSAICSNTDGPRDYHTKWSKSDRGRQILYITYKWNLKSSTWEFLLWLSRLRTWHNVHENVGSIPGLLSALRIQHCHKLQHGSQMWLGSSTAVCVTSSCISDSTPGLSGATGMAVKIDK